MVAASAAVVVVVRSLAEEREGRRKERPQTFAAAAGATLQIPEPSAAEKAGLFTSVDLIDCFSKE